MVEGYEDEKQYRKCPERGPSVAHKGQGNAYNWHYAYGHAYVYEQMHKQATGQSIAVYTGKMLPAMFGVVDYTPYHQHI